MNTKQLISKPGIPDFIIRLILVVATVILFAVAGFSQQTTIFNTGSAWKYKDNGSDQGTAWLSPSFNDTGWSSGGGQFGYGDGDEATVLNACGTVTQYPSCSNKYITYYFRKTFNLSNVNAYTNYIMNFKRDDGIIIYINGTEVYRENMPTGTVTYTTISSSNCSDDGGTVFNSKLSTVASKLVSGSNTIAVEIHQTGGSSSDVTFEMELLGEKIGGGASLTRGPYIQKANNGSVVLKWRSDIAVDSKVTFGADTGSLVNTVLDTSKVLEHTLLVSGLKPYTKYYYTIGTSQGVMQGNTDNYFVTTPEDGRIGKYTFWVAGDCGNNSTNQQQVLSRYNSYIGDNITDGFLLMGDNAYNSGTDAEFTSNFFNIYKGTILKHAALWPVPGNHDYENSATRQDDHAMPYYTIFDVPSNGGSGGVASNTEAFYSYNYGNVHFLALDSYGEEANLRLYDTMGAQVQWIKKDLEANKLPWVIAYWHHPPYTMASHNSDSETELALIRSNFIKLLERYGVDMVMCGHSHGYERSRLMKGHYGNEASFSASYNLSTSSAVYDGSSNSCPYFKDSLHNDGTVYVVAGSAGQLGGQQSTYPHNAMYTSNVTNGGSLVLEIEGNRLDAKWLCADGVIRDKFTIMKEAGKKQTYQLSLGDSAVLEASWKGDYNWNTQSSVEKSVVIKPVKNVDYIVKDNYNCVADSFRVTVSIPGLKVSRPVMTEYCAGSQLMVSFGAQGKFFPDNKFIIQLSDSTGSFSKPLVIGQKQGSVSDSFYAMLPNANIVGNGYGYKIRVVSTHPEIIDSSAVSNSFLFSNIKPAVVLTSSDADNSICLNAPVTFNAQGGLYYQYLLNGTATGSYSTNNIYVNNSLKNGQKVTALGRNACGTDSASILTSVIDPPKITFSASDKDHSICAGQEVVFTSSGADKYEFFIDSTSYGYGARNTFKSSVITDGQEAIAVGSNVCGFDTMKILFKVNPKPAVQLACSDPDLSIFANETVTFTATGADTFEYFVDGVSKGVFLKGSPYTTSSLENGQAVSAKGTSSAGCMALSNSISLRVKQKVSVKGINGNDPIASVYPNPVDGKEELVISFGMHEGLDASVQLTDINGKVVLSSLVITDAGNGNYTSRLDMSTANLAPGIYFVKIRIGESTQVVKLSIVNN